jgi:hypothetical protein
MPMFGRKRIVDGHRSVRPVTERMSWLRSQPRSRQHEDDDLPASLLNTPIHEFLRPQEFHPRGAKREAAVLLSHRLSKPGTYHRHNRV